MFDNINLSIASLPFTLLLSAIPHWYTIYLASSQKVQGGWTNQNPRAFVARLNAKAANGTKLSAVEETILRGQAAQQNGFEWWGVWGVAVVCSFLSFSRLGLMGIDFRVLDEGAPVQHELLHHGARGRAYRVQLLLLDDE